MRTCNGLSIREPSKKYSTLTREGGREGRTNNSIIDVLESAILGKTGDTECPTNMKEGEINAFF